MWLKKFIGECKAWRAVRKACKEHRDMLDKLGMKTDWFGRIYTVINRDFEIKLGSPEDQQLLNEELNIINNMFVEMNIADLLAFEIKPIESETENSYLVIFTPADDINKQYVTVWSVGLLTLAWMSILGVIIGLLVHFL